jgi:hypothetical protein
MRGSTNASFAVLTVVVGLALAAVTGCSDETLAQRFGDDNAPLHDSYSGLLQHPHIAVAKVDPSEGTNMCGLLSVQDLTAAEHVAPLGTPQQTGDLCTYDFPPGALPRG